MKFIRVYIIVNYTLEDDNLSNIYMGSIFDELNEKSVLKNDLSLVLEKRKTIHKIKKINNRIKERIVKTTILY